MDESKAVPGRGPEATYCPLSPDGHHMVSIRTGEKVRWVERCSLCGWIDGAALDGWADNAIKEAMTQRAKRIAVAAETQPFAFVQQTGEDLTLNEILFQALGAASVCWENPGAAGVFDSSRAKMVGEALTREVNRALHMAAEPWANLAHEQYAMLCNSTVLDLKEMAEWAAAFDRLKAQFEALLEKEFPDGEDGAGVPQSASGVRGAGAGGAGEGDVLAPGQSGQLRDE